MGFFAGGNRVACCLAILLNLVCCSRAAAFSPSADVTGVRDFSSALDVTAQEQLGTLDGNSGVKVGAFVRNFKVNNYLGEPTELYDLLAHRAAVIVFYRGGWSAYCNTQIHHLTDNWLEFEKRSVALVLISVDDVAASEHTQRIHQTPFFVLSDPDLNAHSVFNVVEELDNSAYAALQAQNIDVEKWSNRQHHKLAVPSVFVVGQGRTVSWAHTSTRVDARPSAKQILNVLDALD